MVYPIFTAISATIGVVSSLVLVLLLLFPSQWVVLLVVGAWTIALVWFQRFVGRKDMGNFHTALAAGTAMIAGTIMTALSETNFFRAFFLVMTGVLTNFLARVSLRRGEEAVFEQKRTRRLLMMLWVFNAFAIVTFLYAADILNIFSSSIPFFPFAVLGGICFAVFSRMIWHLYYDISIRAQILWIGIVGLVMTEIMWSIHLLPFGYFVSAWLATWLWYVIQILARFHFSSQGIIWKKQRWFILGNVVAYVLVLALFVRWI